MHSVHMLVIFFLLLSLNKAEKLKDVQNRVSSHLRERHSAVAVSSSVSQLRHLYYVDCDFTLNFTGVHIPPTSCSQVETDAPCEIIADFDYVKQEIVLYFYRIPESLTIENNTYLSCCI